MTADRTGPAGGEGGLWGGRFGGALDPRIHAFTNSLPFDRRLARHDLLGSLAHARMLLETGILERADAEAILAGLSDILRELEEGRLAVEGPDEDVHGWIERTLRERIGPAAGRLHTARSRNDQTGAALRLWVREDLVSIAAALAGLADVWLAQAEEHRETWMPGYTHLQRAQPVTLAHHLLAHAWALVADARRLRGAHRAAGRSPLGAGALAGSPHPIDPVRTAELLGFEGVYANSQLAVADRDYVAEAVFACALLMLHLSRWAEEVVLWTSSEFGFAALGDSVSQGSSLMPQKRNPEAAEILRGKSARTIGDLASVLALLKSLPLAYDSDLQEDKEPLFDAVDTARRSLEAAAVLAAGIEYRPERMREALRGGFLTATDLADHLARRGVPFREAHEQAGVAVRAAEARGCELWELPLEELRGACPAAGEDVFEALAPEGAVAARRSPGGPAPERVDEQIRAARGELESLRGWIGTAEGPSPIVRAHRDGRLAGDIP